MTHYQLVAQNKRRTYLIIVVFMAFITLASYLMARGFELDLSFVGFAFIISGISSFFSYFFSDKLILLLSSAKPAKRDEFFDFYTLTENICLSKRVPMPKLYVIEDSAMNAFATGRNPKHAVVCATTGLLNRLERSEVEGVVAHELSHIQNYDMLLMSVVSVLVGLVALMSDWLLRMGRVNGKKKSSNDSNKLQNLLFIIGLILALLSPLIAQLIQLAISRRREFLADASGVAMTKNPRGLAKALAKISNDTEPLEAANKATAHLYIANPLKNRHDSVSWFAKLFSTHPPVQERIAALEKLA